MDFAITELQKPRCLYCEAMNIEFIVIKKQKLTPKVMSDRLKLVTDRMMENLQNAYVAGKEGGKYFEEDELIDIMAKAKKLHQGVRDLDIEKKGKKD